jgi:outer membrane protein assembly factor BamB
MLNGSFCTAGYDVETGNRIWICDGPSEQMVATLLRGHGLIFSLGGYPDRHLLAIREGGTGDITKTHIAWRTHAGVPYVPSPLLYGDLLHVVADDGIYTCFDAKTGKVRVRKRACKHTSSSLVGACQRVYITDDFGTTLVLKNGPDFEVLATNKLGEDVYSSLAISQGNIFIRARNNLYCIGQERANPNGGR